MDRIGSYRKLLLIGTVGHFLIILHDLAHVTQKPSQAKLLRNSDEAVSVNCQILQNAKLISYNFLHIHTTHESRLDYFCKELGNT